MGPYCPYDCTIDHIPGSSLHQIPKQLHQIPIPTLGYDYNYPVVVCCSERVQTWTKKDQRVTPPTAETLVSDRLHTLRCFFFFIRAFLLLSRNGRNKVQTFDLQPVTDNNRQPRSNPVGKSLGATCGSKGRHRCRVKTSHHGERDEEHPDRESEPLDSSRKKHLVLAGKIIQFLSDI